MTSLPFTFVTHSDGKLREARRILGQLMHADIDLPEIQSVEVEEVVRFKVREAFERLGTPVMIEDTGLYLQAWNALPGALVKWFVASVGVTGMCQMLRSFPERRAWAKTAIAIYDGQGDPIVFTGQIDGQIVSTPRGEHGFGWDPIFLPDGTEHTYGEMLGDEKDRFSMRRLAFEQLRTYLLR